MIKRKNQRMKKYRVSLALKVGANFEVIQKARSAKEALNTVLKKYGDYREDEYEITEPDWANMELDVGDDLSGASVEEVEEN